MSNKKSLKIAEHFSCLNDPRGLNRRHKLIDIITIAICAIICGCDGYDHIEEFGKAKYKWFKKFLDLPHGVPSHDTFERVFTALDPKELRRSFISWVKSLSERISGEFVHIDGKTLCGSYDKEADKSAIHMISAWAADSGLVLGQLKTEAKSNEITAIPELIKLLELEGSVISIDAMGCQTKIAEVITEEGADYVLALKGNQKTLHEEAKLFFEEAERFDFEGVEYDFCEETDGGHGRVEVRRCWASSDIEWFKNKDSWSGLKTVAMVESERHAGVNVSRERRYYISSLECDAEKIASAVRSHWGVENSLHWVLDVSFGEDQSRIRKGNGAENMAVLRHIALNMLKSEKTSKKSIKLKRLRAGWDNDYLIKVIFSGI